MMGLFITLHFSVIEKQQSSMVKKKKRRKKVISGFSYTVHTCQQHQLIVCFCYLLSTRKSRISPDSSFLKLIAWLTAWFQEIVNTWHHHLVACVSCAVVSSLPCLHSLAASISCHQAEQVESAEYYSRTVSCFQPVGIVWIYGLRKHTSDIILERWAVKVLHTHLGLIFIKLY